MLAQVVQQSDTGWQLNQMYREPSLALKLYLLFFVISLLVPLIYLIKNWSVLFPLRHVDALNKQRAAAIFRRQAISLQRWIALDFWAWLTVTLAGLLNLLNGISVSRHVGLPVIAEGVQDLLQPSILFLAAGSFSYIVRWHILWRTELLERIPPSRQNGITDTIA